MSEPPAPLPPPAQPYNPASRWANYLWLLVGIPAFIFARFVGLSVIIPLLGWGVLLWVFNRVFPADRKPLANVLAWQGGHLIWFGLGLIVQPGQWPGVVAEIAVFAGMAAGLYVMRNRWFALALAVMQAGALAINAWMLTQQDLLSLPGQALMVHVVWRAVAAVLYVLAFRQLSRPGQDPDQAFE